MQQRVDRAKGRGSEGRPDRRHALPLPGSSFRNLVVTFLCLAFAASLPGADAHAQSGARVEIEVIVAHLSKEPGKIDPAAKRLDRELREQFRYGSIKVLGQKSFRLGVDEVGRHELPNGRTLMVKPLIVDAASALLSVDLTGLVQTDLRLKDDQLVIIGAEAYRDGKLVVALLPRF